MKSKEGDQGQKTKGCHISWLEQETWTPGHRSGKGWVLPSVVQLKSLTDQGEGAEYTFQNTRNTATTLNAHTQSKM